MSDLSIWSDESFAKIVSLLACHTRRAYFVGGFVRDSLLGRDCSDIDIEVYDINPDKFDTLMRELGAIGVGKSFFVYRLGRFDISLPRTEQKTGVRHNDFAVSLTNDERTGAMRRDFTINALMCDIFTGEIRDYFGGLSDLEARILRVVNPATFVEDNLRLLRGIGFACRFGLDIEPATRAIMGALSLEHLSQSRITAELIKIFGSGDPAMALRLMLEFGVFEPIFGFSLTPEQAQICAQILREGQNFIKSPLFFLYIVLNIAAVDKKAALNRLNLGRIYRRIIREPFFLNPSDFDIMSVACEMPLNSWLGCYSKERIERAKALKIYESAFDHGVDAQNITGGGLKGEAIAREIQSQKRAAIERYLAAQISAQILAQNSNQNFS